MEQEFDQQEMQPQEKPYVPCPAWQVWMARIALVVFVAFVLMYYINILRGGR